MCVVGLLLTTVKLRLIFTHLNYISVRFLEVDAKSFILMLSFAEWE